MESRRVISHTPRANQGNSPTGHDISMVRNTHHDINIFMEMFTCGTKRLGGAKLEIPQFILHSAVESLGMLFSHHMEAMSNGSIDTNGEVVVNNIIWDGITGFFVGGITGRTELNLPPIHGHHIALLNLVQHFNQRLPFVAAAPAQTAGQIITGTQWQYGQGWFMGQVQLVDSVQQPSHRPITTTA